MTEPRVGVMEWDWKEYVDLEKLDRLVREVSGGTCFIREAWTGGDSIALVASSCELTEEQVAEYYGKWCGE